MEWGLQQRQSVKIDQILILGYKKANGEFDIWFFFMASLLSVPKLDFVACCVMLC